MPGGAGRRQRRAHRGAAGGAITHAASARLPVAGAVAHPRLRLAPRGQLLVDRESDDAVDRTPHPRRAAHPKADRGVGRPREGRIYNQVAAVWHPRRPADPPHRGPRRTATASTWSPPGDRSPRLLTPGPFRRGGAAVAPSGARWITYVSTDPRPEERQVWRMPVEGGPAEQVSPLPGWNRPIVAPDGEGMALLHSDDRSPPELYLGGQRLTRSPPPEFDRVRWAAGCATSRSREARPASRCTPGCSSPRARLRSSVAGAVRSGLQQRGAQPVGSALGPARSTLVQRGYPVVQVDARGSTGYGRAFREKLLMHSGTPTSTTTRTWSPR